MASDQRIAAGEMSYEYAVLLIEGLAGVRADELELPKMGIRGNSHMLMMDKNNAEVAALIQKWLEGKGLTK